MLTYARIDAITKRLSGRITVINQGDIGILGITGTEIGTDLIYLIGEAIEEMVNMYLGMVYVMPLINQHPFLSAIVEKLICAEIYLTYFPTQGESSDNQDAYTSVLRTQALNDFQTLFDGLGIYVAGASNSSNNLQNDETKQQMTVKAIILPGEKTKKYIGYDVDEDGVVDTDMFKNNTNIQPSFYLAGNLSKLTDGDAEIVEGVRIRPRYYKNTKGHGYNSEVVNFW